MSESKVQRKVQKSTRDDLLKKIPFVACLFYYEVYMTRVLHTARTSTVESVMFVDRNKRDSKF